MNVDLYERIWMYGTGAMLALFFGSTAVAAVGRRFQPPSHVETINPARAMSDPRFASRGVWRDDQGGVHVTVVGMMYVWLPDIVTVPSETPVTFHLTSADVTHGYQIVRTNGQTMVIPGYVSQFTTQFAPGEYLIACNEYCGIGHHTMSARLTVVPAKEWTGPGMAAPAPAAEGGDHAAN